MVDPGQGLAGYLVATSLACPQLLRIIGTRPLDRDQVDDSVGGQLNQLALGLPSNLLTRVQDEWLLTWMGYIFQLRFP